MRHSLTTVLTVLLLSSNLAVSQCRTLVVTGHPNYPPVGWRHASQINGAGKVIVTSIAHRLGLKAISKDMGTWEEAQAATRAGKADVIFGIYYNKERANYFDYLQPPFMQDPVAIMVKVGHAFPFRQWSDLKRKKGVTNKGESYGTVFDHYMAKNLTVDRAPSVNAAFQQLVHDQADYLIIGLYPGMAKARELRLLDQVKPLQHQLLSESMYVAFSKNSACRQYESEFGEQLRQMIRNGRIQPLLSQAERQWETERVQRGTAKQ